MSALPPPQPCFDCRWFLGHKPDTPSEGIEESDPVFHCEAFKGGIPDSIIDGDEMHRQPVEGDHGLRYEKI